MKFQTMIIRLCKGSLTKKSTWGRVFLKSLEIGVSLKGGGIILENFLTFSKVFIHSSSTFNN